MQNYIPNRKSVNSRTPFRAEKWWIWHLQISTSHEYIHQFFGYKIYSNTTNRNNDYDQPKFDRRDHLLSRKVFEYNYRAFNPRYTSQIKDTFQIKICINQKSCSKAIYVHIQLTECKITNTDTLGLRTLVIKLIVNILFRSTKHFILYDG